MTVSGSTNARDFLSIVAKGAAEGSYAEYRYVTSAGPIKLTAPTAPGAYEIRVLAAAEPYATLARRALVVAAVAVALDAPAQVEAGKPFSVRWTGPNNDRDYIAIGSSSQPYITYAYTSSGNPVTLTAPDAGGQYELRYFFADDKIAARRPITIGTVSASVTAPAQVAAGARFDVRWTGPDNPRDFVTIVPADAPVGTYLGYAYTSAGNPAQLTAPDTPGDFEVRYLTAQTYATLGTTRLKVAPVQGSVKGPAEAVAGSSVSVQWTGPDNPRDYVTIVPKGTREGESAEYAWTASGNPLRINAPMVPGEYEIRYGLGQSNATLARAVLKISPGTAEPGFVKVTAASGPAAGDRTVEVIVDASGSMLQRIGQERRIDIARQTLTRLVTSTIPRGTPFVLRVFGREVDSCQTDLVTPLGPLDPAALAGVVGKLEAKSNARTAIGASLAKVADDLRAAKGERVVILLTDGMETCGGNPGAEIEKLQKSGAQMVINIVGFAIDDAKLAASFRQWASLGNGAYFDARDGASLDKGLTEAAQPRFEIVDGKGVVVARGRVGGEPVRVMPGAYQLRVRGSAGESAAVAVKPKETTVVGLR